jgi:septal ring factor EnvC (AmiA/AmiB activator)
MRPAVALGAPALLLVLAAAQPIQHELDSARQAAEQADLAARAAAARAREQAAEADRLAADRIAAAAELRATEDQLVDLSDRIAALRSRQDEASRAAAAAARQLAPLLPLVERLGLYPTATLLSVPARPEDAVRGLILLAGLARTIRARVAALAAERDRAAAALAELDAARRLRSATMERRREQAAALDMRLADAARRREQTRDAATDAARLAAAAAARTVNLRTALTTLEAAGRASAGRHPAPVAAPRPVVPTGDGIGGPTGWVVPVAGRVSIGFGAATDAGPADGETFRAPPGGRVVAPCVGRVVFAGPFRSYGQLLIVHCAAGPHAVLAGLGRLDAVVGQAVRAGEPIGVMAESGGALYVELRRDGAPIDPRQYLRR